MNTGRQIIYDTFYKADLGFEKLPKKTQYEIVSLCAQILTEFPTTSSAIAFARGMQAPQAIEDKMHKLSTNSRGMVTYGILHCAGKNITGEVVPESVYECSPEVSGNPWGDFNSSNSENRQISEFYMTQMYLGDNLMRVVSGSTSDKKYNQYALQYSYQERRAMCEIAKRVVQSNDTLEKMMSFMELYPDQRAEKISDFKYLNTEQEDFVLLAALYQVTGADKKINCGYQSKTNKQCYLGRERS